MANESTQIIQVKKWHKQLVWKYQKINTCKIERHNFCLNYLLIKTNRTALQTYKVEEQTFMDTLYSVPPF